MDFKLNETQEMIRSMAEEFAKKYIANRVEEIERELKVPQDLFDEMAAAGLLGISFPEEYGGAGLGYEHLVLAYEEISKVSASANMVNLVSILFLEAINTFGTKAQKEKYLPAGINGEFRGSMAFTEPGTGSDPKQLTATYRKEGDYYVLNGTKRFISNASYDGPILVFAKDADTGACTGFIFNKFCEGYSISTPWDCVGLKGSAIYDVFMDNVKVPADEINILGGIGKGFNTLLGTVAYSKVGLCATFLGTMAAAYEAAVKYAREKMHRDQPISKFQSIQLKVAKIAGIYESTRLLVYKLGEDANDRSDMVRFKARVGMTKAHVSDISVECNLLAMNVLGAYGVTAEYNVERFLRDSLIAPHIEGVSDLQRIIAGSYILSCGKNKFQG